MTIPQAIMPDIARTLPALDPQGLIAAFNDTELAAIAVAEVDGPETLRQPGRVAGFLSALLFSQVNWALASQKLETLRRLAIYLRAGFAAEAGRERDVALAAGFTPDQLSFLDRYFEARSRARGRSRRRGRPNGCARLVI